MTARNMRKSEPADQRDILRDLAVSALERYDLPAGVGMQLINLSENATYKVEAADGRKWALRVHRYGYHSRAAIASELAWLIALRNAGVTTTPRPIAGMDGELIQAVAHPRLPGPRHIVVSDWEGGTTPAITEHLDGPFEILGELTARMQRFTREWKRPAWFERHTWDFATSLGDDAPHWGRWRHGIGVDAAKARLFGRTVALIGRRLREFGNGAERFGLIHGDLRLANLLIDGGQVKVLDFDDSGFGWHMYDAATPVSFHEHEPQAPALIEAWLRGYRKVLPLAAADAAEIPTFIMLRRLLLVAWIGSHADTDLAKSLGAPYTVGSLGLCEDYLRKMG